MTGNQDIFQKAMERGHSAAWEQRWDQAARFYRQALDEIPDHPMALTSLALALFQMQDFDQALRCYLRAAQLAPTDPIPFEKIASIYERQGRLADAVQASLQAAEMQLKGHNIEKAIENWIHVCSLQPENTVARTRLAMIYDRLGRKTDAVAEYLALASVLQAAGDLGKALQLTEYTLHIKPDSNEAQQALNMLRTNQPLPKAPRPKGGTGPVRMAQVQQLEMPKVSDQQDPLAEARQKAMLQVASLLFEQPEEEKQGADSSRRGLSEISRGDGNLSVEQTGHNRIFFHLSQAIDAQSKGREDQTIVELTHAVENGLHHPAVFFILGMLIKPNKPHEALYYLEQCNQQPEFTLAANLLIGQIYEQENQLKVAAKAYLRAMCTADTETVPPEEADELRQLYEPIIEGQSGQMDNAILKTLCENISHQLLRPAWRREMLKARQEQQAPAAGRPALPLVAMLLETKSLQVVTALANIRLLGDQGVPRTAMEEAYWSLVYAPTYLPLHIQIGDLLIKQNRTQEAMDKFHLVAELYRLRGEKGPAIRMLKRILEIFPMDVKTRMRLIDTLSTQENTDEAIQQYIDLAGIYYQLTELELARQTYVAALQLAQQFSKNRALSVEILYKIADIDLQHLDLRQAVRVFEQVRTLNPDDPMGRIQLIDLLFRLGQDITALTEVDGYVALLENAGKRAAAVEFLSGIISERPDKIDLRRRLAEIYVRNRQIPLAIQQLESMVESQLNAGNKVEAIRALQTIIALKPANVASYQAALMNLQAPS